MLPRLSLCHALLGIAALSAGQNFRLGVNYSELIPTASLTTGYGALVATDALGAVYVLEDGPVGSQTNAVISYYLMKLAGNRVVYQNLLPLTPISMAVDPAGNVYLTIYSTDNQAVVKVATDGKTVAYTINMAPGVNLTGLAVDAAGRAYLAGFTPGNGIQTTPGALQSTPASATTTAFNGFVMRLKPDGAIDYATYLGGSSQAEPSGIAVDAAGSAFVTGVALASDFPTTAGAYLAGSGIPNFISAPFLARLSPDGSALLYSTFVAGSSFSPYYVALDTADNAVVALTANTASIVRRFNPQGTAIAFSKALPASSPAGLAVDAAGNTYFAVMANSNYPPVNSLAACETTASAALTVLDANGTVLQSTYIPGSSASQALALAPDSTVYVVAVPDASFAPTQKLAGLSGGTLSLTILSQNPAAPVVQLGCVASAASYDSAGISGGEIVSLFGQGLGPANGAQPYVDPYTGVPKLLAGVQVTFNDIPGPLLYVQDTQINAISPWALQTGQTVKVCVVYNGAPTNCVTRPVVDTHPGVFTLDGIYAAALNQDGSLNTASHPAHIGDTVSIFATGLGPITPPQPDGALVGIPLPKNYLTDYVYWLDDTFFIGTIALGTTVSYGGPAPFDVAGVSQVNFVVQDTSQPNTGQAPFFLQAGGFMPVGAIYGPGGNGFLVHVAGLQYPTASDSPR
ncbi:MAG TPA: SBBP repeat-containing protein [Bryobacteraceae bacterium]|nr:SBBP repeat-containing protein [Bryobacteraceae bacterium]